MMMWFGLFTFMFFLAAASAPADAYPSFSRQTGATCKACHFHGMKRLTKYGHKFMLQGYRETPEMKQFREKEGLTLENYDPDQSIGFGGSLHHQLK